jgi:hypothetical protein
MSGCARGNAVPKCVPQDSCRSQPGVVQRLGHLGEMAMSGRYYTANASRGDREGYSITFRHPLLLERGTDRVGRKVRRGLGTRDEAEAMRLVEEMNTLLSEEALWDIKSRPVAEQRFSPRTVDIFYSDLVPETRTAEELRNEVLPLPSRETGYRRILLLGTTGSGKTTLVRQFLGTSPYSERFPSTSTARTTVADTELIFTDDDFRAVVTFLPRNQVRDYVEESLLAATVEAANQGSEADILRVLLNGNPRFRLSYILGLVTSPGPQEEDEQSDLDGEEDSPDVASSEELDESIDNSCDQLETSRYLLQTVSFARSIAKQARDKATAEMPPDGSVPPGIEYERMREERVQEALDEIFREGEIVFDIVDRIMREIELRIDLVSVGTLNKTKQGWPRTWSWQTDDRAAFFRILRRFSGNSARFFGQLLTPIVNGLRVSGRFAPDWSLEIPKLVLYDIEGLGHTADSASSLPARVTRRFEDVDGILLVDNAAQSMQAGPIAILRSVGAAGKTALLAFCFTHFDLVRGDNLQTFKDRSDHVVTSVESVFTKLLDNSGPFTINGLRQRLKAACFFVGNIDKVLDRNKKPHIRYRKELAQLVYALEQIGETSIAVNARPRYDLGPLTLGIGEAIEKYHEVWSERMGLSPGNKVHWTQIKALSRRFAEQTDDEYGDLRPIGDLHLELSQIISRFIQEPQQWAGDEPQLDEKQRYFAQVTSYVNVKLRELLEQRIKVDQLESWKRAYYRCFGYGSTIARAEIVASDILGKAAPIPTFLATSERNRLMRDIQRILNDALDAQVLPAAIVEHEPAVVAGD